MCPLPDPAALAALLAKLAFLAGLASLAAGLFFIFRRREEAFSAGLTLLAAAAALQAASFIALTLACWQVPENRYLTPLNTSRGMALALSFCVHALLLGLERWRGTGVTFVFVLPWSLAALAYPAFAQEAAPAALSAAARSLPAAAHNLLFIAGCAAFVNAFGASSALLLSDRELRSRHPHPQALALPSIGDLDRLIWRLVQAGLPLFAAGFLLAGAQLYHKYSRLPGGDIKELGALAVLAVYGAYLLLRRYGDWRGTKAAWANVAGFLFIIATLLFTSRAVDYHAFSKVAF
jgi:ABC-type uncharacterized transport system permease subunit